MSFRSGLLRAHELIDRCVDGLVAPFDTSGFVHAGDGMRTAVALSFDDGPSPHNTPRLLDLLEEHQARATFFVVGNSIAGHERILRRIVDQGHEVGNHTYSHPHTRALTRDQLRQELERTNRTIAFASTDVRFARPPFGKDRRRTASVARELGMRVALWSVDSGDSSGCSTDQIVSKVVRGALPGALVLFHDGGSLRRTTLDACSLIVPALTELGIDLVTISELVAGSGPVAG